MTLDPSHELGLEIHHDGSGHVDLATSAHTPPGRRWNWPGMDAAVVSLGTSDVIEFDVAGTPHPVGTFHQVHSAELPSSLARWGQPMLISHLTGRRGQVRFIVRIPDAETLRRFCEQLRGDGFDAGRLAWLAAAEPLISSPTTVRLGLEYLPDDGTLSPRLGVEVFINPRTFDVAPTLCAMGVPDSAVAEVTVLADQLPLERMADTRQAATFVHFSVSWPQPHQPGLLKSYVMITSSPLLTPAERRDASVRLEGRLWTDDMTSAAWQLPLRRLPAGIEDKMTAWRAEVDPRDLGLFAERLLRDGLTLDTARAVFLPPASVRRAALPWWATYERLVEAVQGADATSLNDRVDADAAISGQIPFAHLLAPIAAAEVRRLEESGVEPLHAQVRRDCERHLLSRLSQTAAAALSEAMWRDAPFGAQLLARGGVTAGDPGRERYLAFCDQHRRNGLAEIFIEYPVLGRLLATVIDQWHRTSALLLDRLARNRRVLAERFALSIDEPLTGVAIAAGDRHNDGNAVTLLRFGERTVVYKPRSVQLEQLYAEAVTALSDHSDEPALNAPAVICRSDDAGEYGYVEFVDGRTCDDDDLPLFYRNAGRLLAVLNALMATDGHHENLLAVGDQLVLIDAETLVMAAPADMVDLSTTQTTEDLPARDSILRLGLLPRWLWLDSRQLAVDISALGTPPAGGHQRGRGWRAINTDAMILGDVSMPLTQPTSLPGAPGEPNRVADFVDELVAGFTDAYRVLLVGRDTWLADLLDRVESAHNRAVLRPTYLYASLIGSLTAPDALRSTVASGMVLERLTRGHIDTEEATWPLVAAEQEALQRLDVPHFTRPLVGGGTRWHGGELNGWPADSQIEVARAHLKAMDEADLRMQVALIRSSVRASAVRMRREPSLAPTRVDPGPAPTPAELAGRSLRTVAEAAFQRRGHASWMGLTMLPDGIHANATVIGLGLYDGRMGAAAGLLLWAQAGPDNADRAIDLCRQALSPVLESVADPHDLHRLMLRSGSGISGLGGLMRGLAFLRDGGVEQTAIAAAERSIIAYLTPSLVAGDARLDAVSGAAGLVAPLVRLLTDSTGPDVSQQHVLDLIVAAAQVLVDQQEPDGGWVTLRETPPLTGFGHGASGIAVALAEAAVALGDSSLLAPARRGLAFEAGLFDDTTGNWPDLRVDRNAPLHDQPSSPSFMLGWCAGAPGIALARLRLLELLPDHADTALWRAELYRAADTTATAPALPHDHLCCGNASRIAILRTLANRLDENRWDADIDRLVATITSAAGAGPPRTIAGEMIPDLPEPGLFTGLPGVGAVLFGGVDWVPRLML